MQLTIKSEEKILNHPWYQKWECGELSKESLATYAGEYFWQVANFPRYLSALHSQLDSLEDRQVVLGNLAEEENKAQPHPELWLDFAESLGLDRAQVKAGAPGAAAAALVNEFHALSRAGQAEALGAIWAYEAQVPEVAKFKQAALRAHYLAPEAAEKGCRFFSVHEAADVWHSQEIDSLVAKLSPAEKERAQAAASRACQALRKFLDAMPN
jgi:pyrroloquinoline-quinone synthase